MVRARSEHAGTIRIGQGLTVVGAPVLGWARKSCAWMSNAYSHNLVDLLVENGIVVRKNKIEVLSVDANANAVLEPEA